MTRSRQKHNFLSWLNRREREIEARKWGHTDTARLIVCAPTWERGGGRQLPRSGITAPTDSTVHTAVQPGRESQPSHKDDDGPKCNKKPEDLGQILIGTGVRLKHGTSCINRAHTGLLKFRQRIKKPRVFKCSRNFIISDGEVGHQKLGTKS